MKMSRADNKHRPNWRCTNPMCLTEFYFDSKRTAKEWRAEVSEYERPVCPYCGSFDTVKK
jgi:hypothetical protein